VGLLVVGAKERWKVGGINKGRSRRGISVHSTSNKVREEDQIK